MPDQITNYFFTQGVLGTSVVCVTIAFIYYYRAAQKKLDEKDKTIFDLQNARLQDSRDTTKEVTDVLQDNAQSMRILSEKIEVGKSLGRMK